ncbi:MAG: acyl carrier protein [Eubacterium sp.]|nr:acyl carrier protein [Eubacterium sp.]SEF81135.1 Phosphopantetheine attachment site [Eubacterium ruminantium]
MEKEQIEQKLADLVKEVMPEVDEDIKFNVDIEQEYGVNSVSIIKLIVAIERKFNVEFTDYELALDNYSTFGNLAELIGKKLEDL